MSQLPPVVSERVVAALGRTVVQTRRATGGCINEARIVEFDDRSRAFLKWNEHMPPGAFGVEARGLDALRAATSLRVPQPYAWSEREASSGVGWIVMEYIAPGHPAPGFSVRLGEGLAELHRHASPGPAYGWNEEGWIGSLPQSNREERDWSTFWSQCRILPLLRQLASTGQIELGAEPWTSLEERLNRVLPAEPSSALLHGDLWSGNVYADEAGQPVLVDPAAYRGDGAVDLAMAQLFGGFAPEFFEAYERSSGEGSTATSLLAAYQLYPLLVHSVLFGGSYRQAARRAALSVLGR